MVAAGGTIVHWSGIGATVILEATSESRPPAGEPAVVASLDANPSARPVLEAALRLDELLGAGVRALHVRAPGRSEVTPTDLAARAAVPLGVFEGPVAEVLVRELGGAGVQVAVIGARSTTGGRRPVGSVTRNVIQRCGRPVLVVPPEAVDLRPIRSALVPVEGTHQTTWPLEEWLPRLAGRVDLMGLHVLTPERTPAMLDRPVRDMLLIADAFHERHLPGADRLEMRSGHVASQVIACSQEQEVDLIILTWMQSGAAGRSQTVLEVLGRSPIPVLLIPGRSPPL